MQKGSRDDRISNLPDDILLTVLDRLNIDDAARTSVLSRRWNRLPDMLSRFTVSVWDFLPHDVHEVYIDGMVRTNAAMTEVIKSILARRDSSRNTIHVLSMTFFLRDADPISIGHVVSQTMATHKVERAEFTVLTVRDACLCGPEQLADHGRQFMLFFDACHDVFGGLTRLHLDNLRFGESDIPTVLTTCKRLKDLCLVNCDSGVWTTLQVEHSQLSELSIVDCRFAKVMLNWILKLTRMSFEGWISFHYPLYVGYVPLLGAINLTNVGLSTHKIVELSKFLRRTSVRDLKLGFKCEKIWVQPECLTERMRSVFHHLRFVNLVNIPEGYDLTSTWFILEAAPSLKELYMTVWDHLCKMETDEEKRRALSYSEDKGVEWESSASDFKHHSLATLVMFGFQPDEYMLSYTRHVMAAVVNLEDVFLYHKVACKKCRGQKRFRFPWTKRQRCSVKKRITDDIDSFAIIHFPTAAVIRAGHFVKTNNGFAMSMRRYHRIDHHC